jgi:hypothetical protein
MMPTMDLAPSAPPVSRSGFVLPIALFMLLVLTALALASFFMTQQEAMLGRATENSQLAFYLSERGVIDVLSDWDGDTFGALGPWGTTTVTDTLSDGTVTVTITRMSANLYLLASESFITKGGSVRQGATRRLGSTVRVLSVNVTVPSAAVTTMGSVTVGASTIVSGSDDVPAALVSMCPATTGDVQEGIRTTSSTTVNISGTVIGNDSVYRTSSVDSTTFTSYGGLDWDSLTALATQSLSQATVLAAPVNSGGNCTGSTVTNFGSPSDSICADYLPVIFRDGNLTLSSGSVGQGILLVSGNLAMAGVTFYGVIIVQGRVSMTGNNDIYGTLMSKNLSGGTQSLGGNSTITYSSCAVNRAIAYSTAGDGYPLETRGWVDLTAAVY